MAEKQGTTINLPPGMSEAEFMKAFGTFMKQRQDGKVRDKAIRDATKELISNHKDEFEDLKNKYMPSR